MVGLCCAAFTPTTQWWLMQELFTAEWKWLIAERGIFLKAVYMGKQEIWRGSRKNLKGLSPSVDATGMQPSCRWRAWVSNSPSRHETCPTVPSWLSCGVTWGAKICSVAVKLPVGFAAEPWGLLLPQRGAAAAPRPLWNELTPLSIGLLKQNPSISQALENKLPQTLFFFL